MKVQLLSTKNGMKSSSLKRLAVALTNTLGYKVWRTINKRTDRKQFRYGDLVNKLDQYKFFQKNNISSFDFTTNSVEAANWGKEGHTVFGRKLLNSSCGHGIVVIVPGTVYEGQHMCPVYTKYKPKKREFRVHIFKDEVVGIVEKRRKKDWQGDKSDAKIRNTENGYVFCQDVELTDALRAKIQQVALKASKVCSSDFRGVDIGYNEKKDDVFVIEVNSAPGIEGTNVDKYVQVIKKYL